MAIHDTYYTSAFRDTVGFHGLKQSREQVEFLVKAIPLNMEQTILDLGCGFGRHSLELASLGYQVTGFDRSEDYLAEARQGAEQRHLKIEFVQGDMRELSFDERFDVVLSLSSSLAFYDEATNTDILRRVYAALRRGGTFFFDQGNVFWLVRNVVPEPYNFDGSTCVLSARFCKEIDDASIESGWDLRFYHLPELKALLGAMGFEFVASFGDFDGSKAIYSSRRLITMWRNA